MLISEIKIEPYSRLLESLKSELANEIYKQIPEIRELNEDYTLLAYEAFTSDFITNVLEELYLQRVKLHGEFPRFTNLY